jgi:hypothetical protein
MFWSGSAAGLSRAHSVSTVPLRGSAKPPVRTLSPRPYRLAAGSSAVLSSMYWSCAPGPPCEALGGRVCRAVSPAMPLA